MFQPSGEDEHDSDGSFNFGYLQEPQFAGRAKRGSPEAPTFQQKKAKLSTDTYHSNSDSSKEDHKPEANVDPSEHSLGGSGEPDHLRFGSLANHHVNYFQNLREELSLVQPQTTVQTTVAAASLASSGETYAHLRDSGDPSQQGQPTPNMNMASYNFNSAPMSLVGTSHLASLMLKQPQGLQDRQATILGGSMPGSAMQRFLTGPQNMFANPSPFYGLGADLSLNNPAASAATIPDNSTQQLHHQMNLPPNHLTANTEYTAYLQNLRGQGMSSQPQTSSQMMSPRHVQPEIPQTTAMALQTNLIQQQLNEIQQRELRWASQSVASTTGGTTTRTNIPAPMDNMFSQQYSQRQNTVLGTDEDHNWLSEFQCFIRSDLIEVIQANQEDVTVRANCRTVTASQAGIRCLHCAHLQPGQRASRSSAFPSSIRQLYQSFTMMQRDHFENCEAIPPDKMQRYLKLQNQQKQGACDSKQYWIYSAKRIGMIDTEEGIVITEQSRAAVNDLPSFGTSNDGEDPAKIVPKEPIVPVIMPTEIAETTSFIYTVLSQLQVIYLLPSERVGKRKTLPLRLEGFGCRHCCQVGRLGFSRSFPLRRRALPSQVVDMYHHLERCARCPSDMKALLSRSYQTHEHENKKFRPDQQKAFYDKLWRRLGRVSDITTS